MSQLKKLFLVLIAFTLFQWMVKCNSLEKNNSESLTTTKNCHCNDLIYDDLYNHFYIDDRTLPYKDEVDTFFPKHVFPLNRNLHSS